MSQNGQRVVQIQGGELCSFREQTVDSHDLNWNECEEKRVQAIGPGRCHLCDNQTALQMKQMLT